MLGPAPVNVAAEEPLVGEPVADEELGSSDTDSDPVPVLGIVVILVTVPVGGVTSASVLVES
jgi:hypothetical protein